MGPLGSCPWPAIWVLCAWIPLFFASPHSFDFGLYLLAYMHEIILDLLSINVSSKI